MVRIVGVILLHITIFLTLLGTVVGTCTMGSADELHAGCFVGSVGYSVAIALLIARPLPWRAWLLLVPAVIALCYQLYWAVGFFVAYHFNGTSACAWKEQIATFDMDGREPLLTAWWLGMSVLSLAGLLWAWQRSRGLPAREMQPTKGK
jgi:hypothetical protein